MVYPSRPPRSDDGPAPVKRPLSAVTFGSLRAYAETVRARLPEGETEMNTAQELIFGPVGRNNPSSARVLEALASLGFLNIRRIDGERFVSIPKKD